MNPVLSKKVIPIGLSVAAVLVAGLVAWTIIVAISSKSDSLPGDGNVSGRGKASSSAPITSVIGKVTAINDDRLAIRALPSQNPGLREDKDITVTMLSATKYVVTSIPSEIPVSESDPSSLLSSVVVRQSELRVGDEVNVRLGMEYDGSHTVTAESIEITRYE